MPCLVNFEIYSKIQNTKNKKCIPSTEITKFRKNKLMWPPHGFTIHTQTIVHTTSALGAKASSSPIQAFTHTFIQAFIRDPLSRA